MSEAAQLAREHHARRPGRSERASRETDGGSVPGASPGASPGSSRKPSPEGGGPVPRPRHLAIVMDGNGRWAQARRLPRVEGHRAGAGAARECVRACAEAGIECLTLFAFSSENWARPAEEVEQLLALFGRVLERESDDLAGNGVNLRFIGDRGAFPRTLRETMDRIEGRTAGNRGLNLVIAANYGGHWDIVNAVRRVARAVERGEMSADAVDRAALESGLALSGLPSPDLLIRTGGEQRISNFLLWNLAYTELHFTQTLWPEFDRAALADALREFGERERRFGRTSEQLALASADAAGAR